MGLDKHGIFRHTYTVADGSADMIQELGFVASEIEIYNESTNVTTFLKGDMASSDTIAANGAVTNTAHITKYDGGTIVLYNNAQANPVTYKDSAGAAVVATLYKDLEGRDSLANHLPRLELADSKGGQYITKCGFKLDAGIYSTGNVIHIKAVR